MKARSLKQWMAVALIVFTTLLSGYYTRIVNPPRVLTRDDGVAKWEERMQPVRKALPASIREIGYIADPDQASQIQEFVLTRYALAPVVVREGAGYEWIVGNFTQPGFEDMIKAQIPTDFTIQKLGAGIYLIHRKLQ